MEEEGCNLFATAFMVGYALPTTTTCQPSQRRPPFSPAHTLRVQRARLLKRKFRLKARAYLTDPDLSFLASFIDPNHVLMEELQWQLKSRTKISQRSCNQRNGRNMCIFYAAPVAEQKDAEEASADMLSSIKTELPAPCAMKESGLSNPATQRTEKGSFIRQSKTEMHHINGVKMEQIWAKGISSRSPDEIQSYMKMKNQLRSKEKKAVAVQATMEMVARKERMKTLEMERRARLRLFVQNMMSK